MPRQWFWALWMLFAFAPAATATVPDPTFSHCDPTLSFNGRGGCAFTVYVRDLFNIPVDSSVVTVDFGTCTHDTLFAVQDSGFTVSGNSISGLTGCCAFAVGEGNVTFRIRGTGSGSCTVKIYATVPRFRISFSSMSSRAFASTASR